MKFQKASFLLLMFVHLSTVLFSQQRGNRQNVPQQSQSTATSAQEVSPQNMAGLIMYDNEVVIKKLKIKTASKKTLVTQAISKHNAKINELKTFNFETFDKVKFFLAKKRNEAMANRDFRTMREAQMQAQEMLAPIKTKVRVQKNMLNETFEQELSEKQNKTWLKYQQAELKKLNPRAQEKQQTQRNSQGSRRGQGRMNN
ncbi:MAG: hypothetical protein HKP59_04985 [Lutibacter sp.]|uniref:hypothetical protein n=1 Tax=Lutibacter sp. TaxID=1925666 RepID=UPI0017E8F06E|nr:hypothetical protein [Lutibacter sp.]MBT8316958.1 hypothetical protein [Lutibacter sp.]NNJ57818.1 hypothetical protein [Lutibacter sp.]